MAWLRRSKPPLHRVHISHSNDFTLQIEPWGAELQMHAHEGLIVELDTTVDLELDIAHYADNFISIWELPGMTLIWTPDKSKTRPAGSRFVEPSTGHLLEEISDPDPASDV
jgi:hypothetical protein